MDDPDVIALVDPDADRIAEQPVVGQRLRPERIHLEARRLRARPALGSGRAFEPGLAQTEPARITTATSVATLRARPMVILLPCCLLPASAIFSRSATSDPGCVGLPTCTTMYWRAPVQVAHHAVLPWRGQLDGADAPARLLVHRVEHRIAAGRRDEQRPGRHHHRVTHLSGWRQVQARAAPGDSGCARACRRWESPRGTRRSSCRWR